MNFLIMHYASGWAFYSGFALITTGTVMTLLLRKKLFVHIARLLCFTGIINIMLSSTPVAIFLLILLITLLTMYLLIIDNARVKKRDKFIIALPIILLCIFTVGKELPFFFPGKPVKMATDNVFVIADSISAGIGFRGERTWSEIITAERNLKVVNKSVGGGTLSSSINTLDKVKIGKDDLVILEIGGNDILAGAQSKKFYSELDRLLEKVKMKCDRVIMLELPLPPFCGTFTGYQRELCQKHKVTLIPKRYFSWVISGAESTVDGLHLSNIGQKKMAEVISQNITR